MILLKTTFCSSLLQIVAKPNPNRRQPLQIRRRKLTGTLASASVACLEQGSKEVTKGEDTDHFMVHCNSKHFVFPERISCHPVKGARLPFTFQVRVRKCVVLVTILDTAYYIILSNL